MSGSTSSGRRLPVVAASTAILLLLGYFVALPLDAKLEYVPDDTFYYLQLAREFARSGQWSFDGGLTKTTGFHLLHGYFCALVYSIAPHISAIAVLSVVAAVGSALAIAALVLWDAILSKALPDEARLAIVVVGASGGFVAAPLMGMEWAWVVFFSALVVWSVVTKRAPLALGASICGTLSRSDFPLLPFALLFGALLCWRLHRERAFARPGAAAALGSVIGFAFITAHNVHVSGGSFIQANVTVKAHWGEVTGYHVLPAVDAAGKITLPGFLLLRTLDLGPLTFVLFLLLSGVALSIKRWTRRATGHAPHTSPGSNGSEGACASLRLLLGTASLVTALGYVAIYGKNAAATQIWYSASFILPIMFACGLFLQEFREPWPKRLAATLCTVLAISSCVDALRPEWKVRSVSRAAAVWLDERVHDARIGSWNAGVLGYFSQNRFVNIDGLVNDEVYPFILAGKLECYLLERNIRYVLDDEDMLKSPYPERGGYANGSLRRALEPVARFVTRAGTSTRFVLFAVNIADLGADRRCVRSTTAVTSAP